ncbi:hypothetical protein [Synechococcus sp. CBW1107]|uniref:hypothetical protein n=1 Tax=Synechococcus sp. CBW1107 TaxID=2789857 RepID=UPI002AD1F4D6|nr:hypothetical protein [Synechococcus sp. CBW1107]CAK6699442.1 hypothetical protein ICNINCKA_02642 [Synechococcus sp. CBW1107]
MTLVEVMVSSVVVALAANGSAQLWGSAMVWNHRAERRQELLGQLDLALLQRERALRVSAAGVTAPMSCGAAAAWTGLQLSAAPAPLPEGVTVSAEAAETEGAGALWITARAEDLERKRLFAPAAHGLCRP